MLISTLIDRKRRSDLERRRAFFAGRQGNRYWWHRRIADAYVPDAYAVLSEQEWRVLQAWYEETDHKSLVGECAVPLISWLASLISSNDITRIVQLGSYAGYSTLMLGWTLRRMGKRRALFCVDIDRGMCEFTRGWVRRAGLGAQVAIHTGDSSEPGLPGAAASYLGGGPQLVLIDSSHQYAHTLRELDLWYDSIPPGGLIALHDVSDFAARFDATGEGGVKRAMGEWQSRRQVSAFSLAYPDELLARSEHVYLDGCGLGLISKDQRVA